MHFMPVTALSLVLITTNAFATEADPVAKAKLAIGEANLVLQLIDQRTDDDPKLDMMCLRLGRFSAILKRIRGSTPLPPAAVTEKYIHYEAYCGWGSSNVLPRGATHPGAVTRLRENLIADSAGLQRYVDTNAR
jgi:hypothetical protein